MADAFTTPLAKKPWAKNEQKKERAAEPSSLIPSKCYPNKLSRDECHSPCPLTPGLCHTRALPPCYLSPPEWWRLLLWPWTLGRDLCRGQDSSIAMIRALGAASTHKIQTLQCQTKYLSSFSVPTPAYLFGADCGFPELCSLLVFHLTFAPWEAPCPWASGAISPKWRRRC